MNYYAVTAFFNGLFGLFVVYYVFLRNPKNLLNQTFALFGLSVAGWSLVYALWCWADNPLDAERYVRTHMSFCVMIPATFFHFTCVFTKNENRFNRAILLNYFVDVGFVLLVQTKLMISGLKSIMSFNYWPAPGVLTPYFVIYFSALVLYCFYLMAKYAYEVTGSERKQTLITIAGFAVGFAGGWTNWFLWFDIPIEPLANFFVGLLFATMLYVIVRYGVMDQDILVDLIRNNKLRHMGLLMAGINHEIKNPLYVIRGLTDTELASEPDESLRNMCLQTRKQLDHIHNIIQKFSLLVKTPSNNSDVCPSADLADVFKNVELLVGPQFSLDRIKINFGGSEGLPALAIDPTHLEEIIMNLVLNAAQAVKEKRSLTSVGLSGCVGIVDVRASLSEDSVEICVKDDGVGIKDLKSLFQVFSTTKSEGSGLGLYITKQLIEKYKGRIEVRSKEGAGTNFLIKLSTLNGAKA